MKSTFSACSCLLLFSLMFLSPNAQADSCARLFNNSSAFLNTYDSQIESVKAEVEALIASNGVPSGDLTKAKLALQKIASAEKRTFLGTHVNAVESLLRSGKATLQTLILSELLTLESISNPGAEKTQVLLINGEVYSLSEQGSAFVTINSRLPGFSRTHLTPPYRLRSNRSPEWVVARSEGTKLGLFPASEKDPIYLARLVQSWPKEKQKAILPFLHSLKELLLYSGLTLSQIDIATNKQIPKGSVVGTGADVLVLTTGNRIYFAASNFLDLGVNGKKPWAVVDTEAKSLGFIGSVSEKVIEIPNMGSITLRPNGVSLSRKLVTLAVDNFIQYLKASVTSPTNTFASGYKLKFFEIFRNEIIEAWASGVAFSDIMRPEVYVSGSTGQSYMALPTRDGKLILFTQINDRNISGTPEMVLAQKTDTLYGPNAEVLQTRNQVGFLNGVTSRIGMSENPEANANAFSKKIEISLNRTLSAEQLTMAHTIRQQYQGQMALQLAMGNNVASEQSVVAIRNQIATALTGLGMPQADAIDVALVILSSSELPRPRSR